MQRLYCLVKLKWINKQFQFFTKIVSTVANWTTQLTKFPPKIIPTENIYFTFAKKKATTTPFCICFEELVTWPAKNFSKFIKKALVITKKTVFQGKYFLYFFQKTNFCNRLQELKTWLSETEIILIIVAKKFPDKECLIIKLFLVVLWIWLWYFYFSKT